MYSVGGPIAAKHRYTGIVHFIKLFVFSNKIGLQTVLIVIV